MGNNGELSGLVQKFYDLLITLAVGGGLLAIITALIAIGGFFDISFTEILNLIVDKVILEI